MARGRKTPPPLPTLRDNPWAGDHWGRGGGAISSDLEGCERPQLSGMSSTMLVIVAALAAMISPWTSAIATMPSWT